MTSLLLLLLAAHGHHKKPKPPPKPQSDAGIEKAVASHQAEVQRCYAFANSGRSRPLSGTVAIHWFVSSYGEPARMALDPSSTLTDEALVQCLEDKLSGWSFPTSDKGQNAAHTWTFGATKASATPAKAHASAKKKRGHRR